MKLTLGRALITAALAAVSVMAFSQGRIRVVPQTSDERIEDIQESPDGTRLLTHDRGYAPRLWDARSMRLLRILSGQPDTIDVVTFSDDGKLLLTVSMSSAWIWDAERAKVLTKFNAPKDEQFFSAAISHDGKRVAVGTVKGKIYSFLSADPSKSVAMPTKDELPVVHIEFSVDGTMVVTSGKGCAVWNASTGASLLDLPHPEAVRWAHFSPDGKLVLTTAYDDKARVFEVSGGRALTVAHHFVARKGFLRNTLMSALFVGDLNREILVAETNGLMRILDARTGAEIRQLVGHTQGIREIRRSQDGQRVATYGDDEQLFVWDVKTGKKLPFTRADAGETAGEFTPDGSAFLVGYEDGSIRRHDLSDGSIRSETLGALEPLTSGKVINGGHGLWMRHGGSETLINLDAPSTPKKLPYTSQADMLSPDGKRLLMHFVAGYNPSAGLFDTSTGKYLMGYNDFVGGAFSPDSESFVTWHKDGTVSVWSSADGKIIKSWTFKDAGITCATFAAPDLIASSGHDRGGTLIWNYQTGAVVKLFEPGVGDDAAIAFSPDGKTILVSGDDLTCAWDTASGKELFKTKTPQVGWSKASIGFSPDGSRAYVSGRLRFRVFDTSTWTLMWERQTVGINDIPPEGVSHDFKTIVTSQNNELQILDFNTGAVLRSASLAADIWDSTYAMGETRIITADPTDGLVVWDAKTLTRLGSLVVMKDGTWLAMDNEGRFDAPDPGNVTGASFVLEWDGGLEAIAVPQLKELFYEPGLFAKILGLDKEAPRPVPNLDALKLYPAIALSKSAPLAVDVNLKPRDNGGIGKVTVWLNGKQVATRKGLGYFKFDAANYMQFLLPETLLPKGRGNIVQVAATNAAGDLSSPPATIDIGIPAGLKAPDVKLFALCVGVSDYAGTGGDLRAPSSDAHSLADAIRNVGEKLLPGRVNVRVLASDGASTLDKPTRENIVSWFEDLSKNSGSGDIVLVFFAGHGVSQIGEKRGYFFLTPEADPTAISEAVASTGAIGAEDLRQMLAKIAANKQVVILDTCHSGAASDSLMASSRSVSGDYQRAWESIKDATGTWLLAGSAADQLSYESSNVDHGMLTYSLLEAIDKGTSDGLRESPGGELFVDVERWLHYAAERVESLKTEVGLAGVQRPEFKRSASGTTFDIGVLPPNTKGSVGLKPPMPIVIVGEFEMDKEDPAGLEEAVRSSLRGSTSIKPWFDVAKHPGVYRVAGSYSMQGDAIALKVYLQAFDAKMVRRTVETFELTGSKADLAALSGNLRTQLEQKVLKLSGK